MVICANYCRVSGWDCDRKEQEIYAFCQLIYSLHCGLKHLAAVAASVWQGLLINELSQARSLGRARGHTSVCHSGLTPSPSPAASRSPRDSPDVPRFLCAAWGPLSPNHHPDIVFVSYNSYEVQSILKQFLPHWETFFLSQMLIWLAGVSDRNRCLWFHVSFEINWCR